MKKIFHFAFICLLLSCSQEKIPDTTELKNEVDCTEVETNLNQFMSSPIQIMKVGEFVHIEDYYSTVSGSVEKLQDVVTEVLEATQENQMWIYKMIETKKIKTKDGVKTETKEGNDAGPSGVKICSKDDTIQYYDLIVEEDEIDTPKTNPCLPNGKCKIKINKVKFFQLREDDNGDKQKIYYDFVFSLEVPYLARMIKFCISSTVTTNGQKVPLTQCSEVRNFDFEKSN